MIWELLILLLRQKSAIDGCDIAELLLKDREDVHKPYATHSKTSTFLSNADSEIKDSSSNDEADKHSDYDNTSQPGNENDEQGSSVKHERYILRQDCCMGGVTKFLGPDLSLFGGLFMQYHNT